jgi:hypothetical protein
MEIHHDRHHLAYVTNLNAAVKDYPAVAAMPLEEWRSRYDARPLQRRRIAGIRFRLGAGHRHARSQEVSRRCAAAAGLLELAVPGDDEPRSIAASAAS